MADRKRFSPRRENALYAVVDKVVTDFRIEVLRGALYMKDANKQEELIYRALHTLGDKVCDEYRRSYAPEPKPE